MIKMIIGLIIDGLFSFLGKKQADSIESENEALKGRADSIEKSFEEQNKAKKDAEDVNVNIGNDDDIFGAKDDKKANNN
jgi:hypothetical protein